MLIRFARRALANLIDPTRASVRERRAVRSTSLAVAERDDTISKGSKAWDDQYRNRANWDRSKILDQVVNAYRANPIAHRIIDLTTEFVIGDGFGFEATEKAKEYIAKVWNDPINNLDAQLNEWGTEAWLTGDLFLIGSINKQTGRVYWRACPSENISEIETKPNDYRQETLYKKGQFDETPYEAYDPTKKQTEFVRHYPLNRLVGSTFGESDLACVLYWILLYKQFLEDRARINFFRQLFTFILQKNFMGSETDKAKYTLDFMRKMPKKSGGVLALDADETLGTINPQLASFEAEQDGLQIKRMIATGVGVPMHFLAEPEGSTRTTAEAAGTPTFRRFKMRQTYLKNVLLDVLTISYNVQKEYNSDLPNDPKITISAPDITERDNANLAIAVQRITQAFSPLYNAKKISAKELIRLVYRFLAEVPPTEQPEGFADTQISTRSNNSQGIPPSPDQSATQ